MTDPLPPLDQEEVRQNWTRRAKPWTKWADQIEAMAQRFNEPMLAPAEIAPGQQVLDLASGAGEPALTIAKQVAPDGVVTATDLIPDMLDGLKARAAERNITNIRFEQADMTALPYGDASFDRVTCRFGIMFVPDPLKAFQETRRVLKPGGRTVWLVWGPIEDTTLFDVLQREVRAALGMHYDPDLPQFRFGAAGLLGGLLEQAGFTAVEEQEIRFRPRPKAGVKFWLPNMEMSFADALDALTADERAAVDARVEAAFADHIVDGRYQLSAHIRLGIGVKSSQT